MHFTIITPSFNQLDYLKRCVASVRDQVAPEAQQSAVSSQQSAALSSDLSSLSSGTESSIQVHHHVQDALSADGTREYLAEQTASSEQQTAKGYSFSYISEPDSGMYDAINRGVKLAIEGTRHQALGARGEIRKAKAEDGGRKSADIGEPNNYSRITNNCDNGIVAWLNCDEQYLPGTLQKVVDYFTAHPAVDFVYGNTLLLDPEGALLTYRKNPPLRKVYVQSDHLYIQSASIFFRERVFRSGLRFSTDWLAVSDIDFVLRLLDHDFRPGRMDDYLSIFTMTGGNLSATSTGRDELRKWRNGMPVAVRATSLLLRAMRYLEKWVLGGYRERFPLTYSIYLEGNASKRQVIRAESGTARFTGWSR